MSEFNKDHLELFLATVRKYMQLRGGMGQKDLAELTETGVSTMSRFLNLKTTEINSQLIAKIVAKLNIPLYEIIDFVEEDYTDRFTRLVQFYKEEKPEGGASQTTPTTGKDIEGGGTAKRDTTATVSIGGKQVSIPFQAQGDLPPLDKNFFDKLSALTPSQRAYVTEFLNLDMGGRDLMVDLGNTLFRFFRHKGMDL